MNVDYLALKTNNTFLLDALQKLNDFVNLAFCWNFRGNATKATLLNYVHYIANIFKYFNKLINL